MAFKLPNGVHETTSTSGTGPVTLEGAITGRLPFSSQMTNGDTTLYSISDNNNFEVGIGTYSDTSGITLSRDTILFSTNGGAAVNWPSGGTRNVTAGLPGDVMESLIDPNAANGLLAQVAARVYARRSIVGGTNVLVTDGDGVAGNPTVDVTGTLIDIQIFTSSGTWTKPAGCSEIEVTCIGGGGGGGSAYSAGTGTASSFAGGGGAGALAYSHLLSGFGATETVTVGAGGAGGTTGSGGNGGTTSFGSLVVAKGGSGAARAYQGTNTLTFSAGGLGGSDTTSTGQRRVNGGAGHPGSTPLMYTSTAGDTWFGGFGGAGGVSALTFGSPGRGGVVGPSLTNAGQSGGNANGYGCGGGGGASVRNLATDQNGGDGGGGIVIVRSYS